MHVSPIWPVCQRVLALSVRDRDLECLVGVVRVCAMSGRGDSSGKRRRWPFIVAPLLLVGLVGGGWFIGSRLQSPEQAAAKAGAPPASLISVPVELRVLSATLIVRGDVRAGTSVAVSAPASVSGSPVVTGVFVKTGDQVAEGQRVVEVSGRPVFVLSGDVPVYRELRPGMTGADIAQLQTALVRLGCAAETDGIYGPATKLCVTGMYDAAGYSPLASSTTEAADLVAARQAVTDADAELLAAYGAVVKAVGGGTSGSALVQAQTAVAAAQRGVNDATALGQSAVTRAQTSLNVAVAERDRVLANVEATPAERDTVKAAVADAQLGVSDAQREAASSLATAKEGLQVANAQLAEASKRPDVSVEQQAFDQAAVRLDAAKVALVELERVSGPVVAQGEIVFMPGLPARVDSAVSVLGAVGAADPNQGGDPNAGSGGLVTLTAGGLRVSARVGVSDKGLLRNGMSLDLLDELSGNVYPATLSEIAADPTVGIDGLQAFDVILTPVDPLPDSLSGANLRVTFTAAATDGEVLVVPLAAVSAGADGQARVDVVGANGKAEQVDVTAGLSADGFVEITPVEPGAIKQGDLVVVGQ